ncbi:FAD-dependent monooxygenase [Dactylosporangium sp. NPDC051541]|uniref:FAD-dependent monooxygenase n=1 Tax=Dactylosporangium sp. NPDC051541 TaxID=3363977 RepID=UPI00378BFD50
MNTTQVLVVGGGPTGLWLACELRRCGVDAIVLDRRSAGVGESRAGGLHARSLEILRSRGVDGPFLAEGRRVPAAHFAGLWLDMSRLSTEFPYVLGLVQSRIEALLAEHLRELGPDVRWNTEVTGVSQTADHAEVTTADGERLRADYVVAGDGGRSTVRRLLGIAFEGTDATVSSMLADVVLADPPAGPIFQQRTPLGDFSVLQLQPGCHRLMTNHYEPATDRGAPLDLGEFREAFVAMAGTDFGLHSPQWTSRYHDAARLAARYRDGRVLLAGDAAHIHWPAGGQGLNTGLQDATDLGWKLALTLRGHSTTLLDTYEAERRPVAERVLANTRAQTALCRPGPHVDALRATTADLLTIPAVNDRLAAMVAGLDQGERAPDVPLTDGRGALVGAGDVPDGWADRVDALPGERALLVRPDGYVAWSGGPGRTDALATWFGQPAPSRSALSRA